MEKISNLYKKYSLWREKTERKNSSFKKFVLKNYQVLLHYKIFWPRLIKKLNINDFNSLILDLGCGNGKFLKTLYLCGYKNLVGVDIQEGVVSESKFLYVNSDLNHYLSSIEASTVNTIVLLDVLEHLDLEKSIELMLNIHRVLVMGGSALIRVPNMASALGIQVGFGDLTHKMHYTKNSLTQLILLSNFEKFKFYNEPLSFYPPYRFLLRLLCAPIYIIYYLFLYSYGAKDFAVEQNLVCILRK